VRDDLWALVCYGVRGIRFVLGTILKIFVFLFVYFV